MNPGEATTNTFILIGTFDTQQDAQSLQKYLKTRFLRALLGSKKVTQHNTANVWSNIPLQDFTENSDINWNATITEIDKQLYKKYNLTNDEINFIETKVVEMT